MDFNLTLNELYALREVSQRAMQSDNLSLILADEERVRLRWSVIQPVLNLYGDTDFNSVWFNSKSSIDALLIRLNDAIDDEEKRKRIIDEQVRAAKWSWLSYVIAGISALSALVSTITALIAVSH